MIKCMHCSIKYVELVVSYLKEGKQIVDEMKRKMKMKMKSVTLFFLFFLLLEALCSEGCLMEERQVLLDPNSRFDPPFYSSWDVHTDCCEWEGVECNSSTGRVALLEFSMWNSIQQQYINYSDFSVFKDLKKLYLLYGNIVGCVGGEGLPNLELLHISGNRLNTAASIVSCLDGLPSLKSLGLDHNGFNASSFRVLETLSSKLPNLEVLDISENYLTNHILPSLEGFTSLKELYLWETGLDSDLHIEALCSKLRNLELLDLSDNNFNHTDIVSALSGLSSLKSLYLVNSGLTWRSILNISKLSSLESLDLGYNGLNESESIFWRIKENDGFKWPTNLQKLWLSHNSLSNEFVSSLSGLSRLQSLHLRSNQLEGAINISGSKSLSRLDVLDLDGNMIDGKKLRESLRALSSSIRKLHMSYNNFTGTILAEDFHDLSELEHLTLDKNNNMENEFFKSIGNLTSLKVLSLSDCQINGTLPAIDWSKLKKLEELNLIQNGFEGFLPKSFINMTSLWKLDLSQNHFMVKFDSNIATLTSLEYFDFTENQFEVPVSFTTFVNHSNLKGSVPRELGKMELLYKLDLSNNQLSEEISEDIFEAGHKINFLELSNNKLEGPIFTIPTNLEFLSLSDNNFSGRLPSNIFNISIVSLDVSNNHLVGKIPRLLNNLSRLLELRMSNNHFEGFIPLELTQLEDLKYLDLSQNDLTGLVPPFINSSVKFIHLSNNHLVGLSKKMFTKKSSLVMLDLSYNEISGDIQDMIEDLSYSKLNFLFLKGNHITGNIPKQLCQLRNLTMLDLSDNKFLGEIPHCLGTMPFDNNNIDPLLKAFQGSFVEEDSRAPSQSEHKKEKASFTSKKIIYTYIGSILAYMSGIDLSNNKLKGNIPYELGNLIRIHSLNLSHNDLIGQIPDSFSNLVQTESLDISFNMLSGEIPRKLNNLTSLEVFNVTHNNLSGPIPEWTNQFATFDESSYEGNPFLCGAPLPKSCHPPPTIILNDLDFDKDNDMLVDIYVFYVL
ncbi:hypothetical protein VNO80_07277 [Phaseolus coccineus]|uniref:Leucine-rich repeat-containing N-terminal plant-type domain-containing protein n=1 Tax=Phaseolus coccineus TaxID=3886 RepID=A0AAN9NJD7_PHACN